jgi:hypothetical protein
MSAIAIPRAELLDRARARELLEQRRTDKACAEWKISHQSGLMFWLRECTRTENYHWKEQGLPPVAPFPYKPYRDQVVDYSKLAFPHDLSAKDPVDYLDIVAGYLLTSKQLLIPKSRELMTSWLVTGYITWFCQFFPQIEWLAQSETDDKAMGLIKYANILYVNQPEWMKKLHPLKRGEEGTAHEISWANGSTFRALPQGVRKSASFHPYGYFNDESAHQVGWKAAWDVAGRACKQMIGVSSAAPSDFGIACEMQG